MKIQPITTNSNSNAAFKAKPVGLARDLLYQALYRTQVDDRFGQKEVTKCQNLLVELQNFGKHFYGKNKPIEILASEQHFSAVTFSYKEKNGKLTPFLEHPYETVFTKPITFVSNIVDALKKIPCEDKYVSASYDTEQFMTKLFGNK